MQKSGHGPAAFSNARGEAFDTKIVRLTETGIKQIKKTDWQFNWHKELKYKSKEVYKLTTINNPTIIQGLLSNFWFFVGLLFQLNVSRMKGIKFFSMLYKR